MLRPVIHIVNLAVKGRFGAPAWAIVEMALGYMTGGLLDIRPVVLSPSIRTQQWSLTDHPTASMNSPSGVGGLFTVMGSEL